MADRDPEAHRDYDEFGLFHENAQEAGLEWNGPPTVERVRTDLPGGRHLSALRWGTGAPQLVLLHGGGQNAHTWDTVALALDRPLLAVDLPGHGHSGDVDPQRPVGPRALAADVVHAVRAHAPEAEVVVGMSLGGLTAMVLARIEPDLVRRLVMVDITPGADRAKTAEIHSFLAGPESFESFDEILERTMAFNPTRSESSLRRGILHNARRREDGRWVWRHQRTRLARPDASDNDEPALELAPLWDDLGLVDAPVRLVLGDRSPVVDDDDVARFREARPDAEVITVPDAGHSIQGDQPVALARLLEELLTS